MTSPDSGNQPSRRKRPGSKTRASQDATAQQKHSTPAPDPRVMEKSLADIGKLLSSREFTSVEEMNLFLQSAITSGEVPTPPAVSALEQAQEMIYQAWESSGKRRITLARRALKISPDCADAYVLLAEESARSLQEAIDLYEQGMHAGERALGPERFEEDAGHFWGLMETRPYMRARAGLAGCLWLQGERDQAIEHYQEMLRLNPNDNQGIRYLLADCLLTESRNEELSGLLEQYDEATAWWLYTKALWLYQHEGASSKANRAAKAALRQNRYVPLFLQEIKTLPPHPPAYVGFGDENEAVSYVLTAFEKWHETPGAVAWLASLQPPFQTRTRIH